MNTEEAAKATIELIVNFKAIQDPDGNTVEHALWMLLGISTGYIQYEKAHRWLGYAQALIVANEIATLHDMRAINQDSGQ